METYDLVVLGGGPAGYLAAERAASANLKTLLIEKNKLGGVCLNEGCIPSKTFLNSAKVFDYAEHAKDYGINIEGLKSIDQKFIVDRKNKVVSMLVGGIKNQLRKNKVDIKYCEGFINKKTEQGIEIKCENETIIGKRLIIATGSTPVIPPIKGLKENIESGNVLTNKEILDIENIPKNLTIIGGGVIGLEMASYFSSCKSKVTVIEMLDKIAGPTESEISLLLLKSLEKKGVEFKLKAKVTEIEKNYIIFEQNGKTEKIKYDKALLSIGRKPVIQNLGIENLGIYIEKNFIKTDDNLKTNVANVYACGDVNGKIMLAHTAYREAEVAVNTILGKKDKMKYNAIPSVIYTSPEVASVGETLESALQKGIDAKCISLPLSYSGRYVAENNELNGLCKIIVNKKLNTLIGAHIFGPYSSEYIVAVSTMIDLELNIETIKKIVFPHPTVSEILREAIFQI